MAYTVRSDPALMRPFHTVRVELPTSDTTATPPPGVIIAGDDKDVWTVNGPPPATPPPGMESGDTWIDVASGDVFVLTE